MNDSGLHLSDLTRRHVESAGEAGRIWLATLPGVVDELTARWSLSGGEAVAGGSGSYVRHVTTADGTPAVLKIAFRDPDLGQQAAVLTAAGGRGYVRLLAFDEQRQAMLLPRLGAPLRDSGLPREAQLDVVARLLVTAWSAVPLDVAPPVPPGEDKASGLRRLVTELDRRYPGLCAPTVRARALRAADLLATRFDPQACVVVHGDPHTQNALEVPGNPGTYAFIDPNGFRCDPAYDAGVALRDWSTDLLAAGQVHADSWMQRACERMATATGLDVQRVWEWAFLERVSTGLYVTHLGSPEVGRPFLESAALLL